MLPDKTIKCHRTGFKETCFSCVTEHGCRLWKHVRIDADRATGQINVEHYDCLDSLMDTYMKNLIGRQDTTTASVDHLRKEVAHSNDAGMASALMGLNTQVRHMAGVTSGRVDGAADGATQIAAHGNGSFAQKLIEG